MDFHNFRIVIGKSGMDLIHPQSSVQAYFSRFIDSEREGAKCPRHASKSRTLSWSSKMHGFPGTVVLFEVGKSVCVTVSGTPALWCAISPTRHAANMGWVAGVRRDPAGAVEARCALPGRGEAGERHRRLLRHLAP